MLNMTFLSFRSKLEANYHLNSCHGNYGKLLGCCLRWYLVKYYDYSFEGNSKNSSLNTFFMYYTVFQRVTAVPWEVECVNAFWTVGASVWGKSLCVCGVTGRAVFEVCFSALVIHLLKPLWKEGELCARKGKKTKNPAVVWSSTAKERLNSAKAEY